MCSAGTVFFLAFPNECAAQKYLLKSYRQVPARKLSSNRGEERSASSNGSGVKVEANEEVALLTFDHDPTVCARAGETFLQPWIKNRLIRCERRRLRVASLQAVFGKGSLGLFQAKFG